MLSQTAEYALRATVWLAANGQEGPVGHQRIAEETQVPASYLSKVLQGLAKSGIVTSRRGVGGGFTLAEDPAELSVLKVINAVDPIQRITGCPLGLKSHRHALCPMHARLDEAMQQVETAFGNSTIADIVNDKSRPIPMVDRRQ